MTAVPGRPPHHSRGRRGRAVLPQAERKDRLIQTRVAEDLDSVLREEAKKKRVTVSQLIRNVLEDTFHLVDNVVSNAASMTQSVTRDALRIAASAKGEARPVHGYGIDELGDHADGGPELLALEKVFAWQDVVLARD